ncbi:MAG: leucyl aminopeptidase [Acidimicrobiales bacterium]|nr:leucyl aminopeptidase [Acidimicrobiales bacterium]
MKYLNNSNDLLGRKSQCITTSLKEAKKIAKALGASKQIANAVRDFSDKPGANLCIQLEGKIERILIIGGINDKQDSNSVRKLMGTVAARLVQMPIKEATFDLGALKSRAISLEKLVQEISIAISNASYQYSKHKSEPPKTHSLAQIRFHSTDKKTTKISSAIKLANALDSGLQIAKDLGNEPPNICNPNYLLKESRKLGKSPLVKVSNLNESKMDALGMGAFMAVSKGSDAPGQMIIIHYNGGKAQEAPIVLIGKGITFDTGGISLKPPPAMDEMKFDMCGAASVIGATAAAINANLKINLITIVAAAENMPSGRATRPGDIVKSYSGKTIEILNTDAEGRLVLCDAITYAKSFKPKAIIDVATLTGACIVALGSHASALYSNDDSLANSLENAASESGDKAWRMPLWDEYQANLNSNFADMANVGGREAGSVVAACFLSRFAEKERWAHLDVAGSAFHSGARKGSSGRPVPLLFKYLQNQQS